MFLFFFLWQSNSKRRVVWSLGIFAERSWKQGLSWKVTTPLCSVREKKNGWEGLQFTNTVTREDPPPFSNPPRWVCARAYLLGAFPFADESGAVWRCADASPRVRSVNWSDCLCTIIEAAGWNRKQTCGAAVIRHVFSLFSKSLLIPWSSRLFLISSFSFFIIFHHALLRLFDGALIKLQINLPHTSKNSLFSPRCANKHATLGSSCLPTCRLSRYLCLFHLSNRVKLRVK